MMQRQSEIIAETTAIHGNGTVPKSMMKQADSGVAMEHVQFQGQATSAEAPSAQAVRTNATTNSQDPGNSSASANTTYSISDIEQVPRIVGGLAMLKEGMAWRPWSMGAMLEICQSLISAPARQKLEIECVESPNGGEPCSQKQQPHVDWCFPPKASCPVAHCRKTPRKAWLQIQAAIFFFVIKKTSPAFLVFICVYVGLRGADGIAEVLFTCQGIPLSREDMSNILMPLLVPITPALADQVHMQPTIKSCSAALSRISTSVLLVSKSGLGICVSVLSDRVSPYVNVCAKGVMCMYDCICITFIDHIRRVSVLYIWIVLVCVIELPYAHVCMYMYIYIYIYIYIHIYIYIYIDV